MPCWVCKAAILALVIALFAALMQVAAVSAAVINAIQAILLALEAIAGVSLAPTVVTGALGIIAGFSVNEFAEWLCCKVGVARCCED